MASLRARSPEAFDHGCDCCQPPDGQMRTYDHGSLVFMQARKGRKHPASVVHAPARRLGATPSRSALSYAPRSGLADFFRQVRTHHFFRLMHEVVMHLRHDTGMYGFTDLRPQHPEKPWRCHEHETIIRPRGALLFELIGQLAREVLSLLLVRGVLSAGRMMHNGAAPVNAGRIGEPAPGPVRDQVALMQMRLGILQLADEHQRFAPGC